MFYTNFQRKTLEENMVKIEEFGKKLEPNLKKLYNHMISNSIDEMIVSDFEEGKKYLDDFRVHAEVFNYDDDKKILRVAYREEKIGERYHTTSNNLIVCYTEEYGADVFYVDEKLYEYTIGLRILCADDLNNTYCGGGAVGDTDFREECQQILMNLLEVKEN